MHSNTFEGGCVGNNPDPLELQCPAHCHVRADRAHPGRAVGRYYDADKMVDGEMPEALRICVSGAEVLNADGPNGYASPRIATADHCLQSRSASRVELPF